jgi:hypothetical protein
MKKIILQILLVLFAAISISAQAEEQKPELFDEFGRVALGERMQRLGQFMYSSTKTPNLKGHIRIYGSNENCFLCRYRLGSVVDAYFKNTIKISTENYSIDYCDENAENLRTELYLMPPATELPKCAETFEMPKNSVLFDSVYFYSENIEFLPLEASRIEIEEPTGGIYSVHVLKKVKSLLDKSPESKIYIVGYLSTNEQTEFEDKNGETIEKTTRNLDKKSLGKKMFQNAKKEFVKSGINLSQIKTIEGGYLNGARRLDFWLVPKAREIPKPKPEYFPNSKNKNK